MITEIYEKQTLFLDLDRFLEIASCWINSVERLSATEMPTNRPDSMIVAFISNQEAL